MKDLSKIIAAMAISASGVSAASRVETATESEERQTSMQSAELALPGMFHLASLPMDEVEPDLSRAKVEIEEAIESNFLEERISLAG
ncbi:hypothetical protein V2O64_18040 [Verrucomicrobiaceae bacterium 227]